MKDIEVISGQKSLIRKMPTQRYKSFLVYISELCLAKFEHNLIKAKQVIEQNYNILSKEIPTLPHHQMFQNIAKSETALVDLYNCHGAQSQGSGRSILVGGYQLKGVGRTLAASFDDNYRDASGGQDFRKALREILYSNLFFSKCLSSAQPIDFLLASADHVSQSKEFWNPDEGVEDLRVVIGRQGSPIRAAHIQYLVGEAMGYPRSYRLNLVREFLVGVQALMPDIKLSNLSGEDFEHHAFFDSLMNAALLQSAEARINCFILPNWADNYDVRGRIFDSADARFQFPVVDVRSKFDGLFSIVTPPTLFDYMSHNYDDPLSDRALQSVCNAFLVIRSVCSVLEIDFDEVIARYPWETIDNMYKNQLKKALNFKYSKILTNTEHELMSNFMLKLFPTIGRPSRDWCGHSDRLDIFDLANAKLNKSIVKKMKNAFQFNAEDISRSHANLMEKSISFAKDIKIGLGSTSPWHNADIEKKHMRYEKEVG